MLSKLSVFRSGFHTDSAQAVADASAEILATLVDRSLIRARHAGRFQIHELIRQYAADKLQQTGAGARTRYAHLTYFAQLFAQLETQVAGVPQPAALQTFDVEHDNLRFALTWVLAGQPDALETGETTVHWSAATKSQAAGNTAAWLVAHLGRFWAIQKHWSEGRMWVEKALASASDAAAPTNQPDLQKSPAHLALRARLLFHAGLLASNQDDYHQAHFAMQESLALHCHLQDRRGEIRCLHELGSIVNQQGDYATTAVLLAQSLAKSRALGDAWCVAYSLLKLGNLAAEQNDYRRCTVLVTEALELFRRQQDSRATIGALILLGQCALDLGNYRQAETMLMEVLALDRQINPQSKGGPWTLRILGLVAQMQGKYDQAADYYRRSLVLRQEQRQPAGVAWALEGLAEVAAAQQDARRAALLWGAAEQLRQQANSVISADDRIRYEAAKRCVLALLGETNFQAAWAAGRAMQLDEILAHAAEESFAAVW